MAERGPEQPQNIGEFPIDQLPDIYTSTLGRKDVRVLFGALRGIVPEYIRSDVTIDLERVAQVARFGGLDQVSINIVDEKDQEGFQFSTAPVGGAASASQAVTTHAILELTDLLPIEEDRVPHSGRWGKGTINIRKQDIDDVLHGEARNAEKLGKFLNQKIYEGTLQLAQDNLNRMTPTDWKTFLISQGAIIGWTLLPIPVYLLGATDPGFAHLVSPVTAQEEVIRFGFTEALVSALSLFYSQTNRRRRFRISEGGGLDPEFVRRGIVTALRHLSRFQAFRERNPLIWGANRPSEVQ